MDAVPAILVLLVLTIGAVGIVAVCSMWIGRRTADIYRFLFHNGKQQLFVGGVKGVAGSRTFTFQFELAYQIKMSSLLDWLFVRRSLKIETRLKGAVEHALVQVELNVPLGDFEEHLAFEIMRRARMNLHETVSPDLVDITGVKLISITPDTSIALDNQPAPVAGE